MSNKNLQCYCEKTTTTLKKCAQYIQRLATVCEATRASPRMLSGLAQMECEIQQDGSVNDAADSGSQINDDESQQESSDISQLITGSLVSNVPVHTTFEAALTAQAIDWNKF